MTWDGGEDVLTHVALRPPSQAARQHPPNMSQNSSIQPQMSRLSSKAACFGRARYKTPELLVGRSNPEAAEKDTRAPQSLAGGCHHGEGLHPSRLPTIRN